MNRIKQHHQCTCGIELVSFATPVDAGVTTFVDSSLFRCPTCVVALPSRPGSSSTQWFTTGPDGEPDKQILPSKCPESRPSRQGRPPRWAVVARAAQVREALGAALATALGREVPSGG